MAEALMVAFAMIVDEELGERTTEVPLTHRNEAVQAFLVDGAHKTLRVLTGHKTRSVFEWYNIVSECDLVDGKSAGDARRPRPAGD